MAKAVLAKSPREVAATPLSDVQNLVHELRAHQVELEMQNEELRRVQLELETSRDRFERLYDLSPVGYLTLDAEGVIREANLTVVRLLGLSRRELLKQKLSRFIAPESQDAFSLHCRQVFATAGPQSCELPTRRPDGAAFSGRLESLVETAGPDQPTQCLVVLSDVTLRLRAEDELKQLNATLERRVAERTAAGMDAHERLHTLIDTASIGIITLDKCGVVETLNPMALQIFGCTLDEMAGSNIIRWMGLPQQWEQEVFLVHQLKAARPPVLGVGREILGRRKDGSGIMLELTVTEFTDSGRRQFVAMVRDITERKRLERELLEISEREQQRIGHDLHDSLGQQLHGLSYLAELLEKDLQKDTSAHVAAVGQLNKYLHQALELTRAIAHGLLPVKAVPEGLMLALRELAECTREIYSADCRFECRSRVLIHRHSAATHLYRIAQEAVNNAMRHGNPTRVRIQLAATPDRIILGIRDNGVGIRRSTETAKGMGLHVMQYRADSINGSLIVQRHPRGGTEVVCTVTRQAILPHEENH